MVFKGYRVTSSYGWRIHPISKVRKFHGGIDLVKNHNDPIYSFTDGVVSFAGMNKQGFGNLVIVTDHKGYRHFYAHLNSISVRKGYSVTPKVFVGRQGATGNVTGSHLHYEVRNPQNKTVDPTTYLQGLSGNKGGKRVVKKISVDGIRGKGTILRWQQFLGTYQDGIISRPSNMIKKWQEFLNCYAGVKLKVDGYEGAKTVQATQKFLGTYQDGVISKPSNMVKGLQRFLNSYGQ